jgi:hypothetical protein
VTRDEANARRKKAKEAHREYLKTDVLTPKMREAMEEFMEITDAWMEEAELFSGCARAIHSQGDDFSTQDATP